MSSSLNRFRLITFDVTNTLLQFRSFPGKLYGDVGALFGVLCDKNVLAKNFRLNWRKMSSKHPNFGRSSEMSWNEWWRQIIQGTFADSGTRIPEAKFDNFSQHLLDLYTTSFCWQLCNGSLDLLNYLQMQQKKSKEQDLVLGIVSNFDPRLDMLLLNMKINQYFNFVLNSYDCRSEKPGKEIFDLAIKAANIENLKAAECLHIGDGPTTDYLGAKAVGWNAALVHERKVDYLIEKYGPEVKPDFVFQSLFEFHKRLQNDQIKW